MSCSSQSMDLQTDRLEEGYQDFAGRIPYCLLGILLAALLIIRVLTQSPQPLA